MCVNEKKYDNIINKVQEFDKIRRKEIIKQNKNYLISLKSKRNLLIEGNSAFPALDDLQLKDSIYDYGYESDYGLPKLKSYKKNTVSRKSSSTQLSNNYELEKKKSQLDSNSKEINFNINQRFSYLERSISFPPGNFFFPLKENFKKSEKIKEDDDFFFKYFGDEKLEEVNNVIEKEYIPLFSKKTSILPNCIKSNALLIEIFKHIEKTNILNGNEKYYDLIKRHFPGITTKQFQDRMIMLFFRYKSKYTSESIFNHLSCKKDEEFTFDNIIGTFKEFLCSVCMKYGCLIHGINQKVNYDNPDEYDIRSILESYNCMMNTVLNYREKNESVNEIILDSNNDFIQDTYKKKDDIKRLGQKYLKNYFPLNAHPTEQECNNNCFICLVKNKQISEEHSKKTEFSQITEIYFKKLFRIFKFEACNISFLLNFLFSKPKKYIFATQQRPLIPKKKLYPIFYLNNTNEKENTVKQKSVESINPGFSERNIKIKCSELFNKLYQEDLNSLLESLQFDHKKISSIKSTNKRKKKSSIHKDALKKIKENDKNYSINEFKRCAHKGNEECNNDNCECFARGFCEKYCACNKDICKLYRRGCVCKSECLRQSCPCLASGIECDKDKCKGCFHVEPKGRCKNRHYFETSNVKNLGVGISDIAGWGIFALENIKKGDFICEYTGEIISNEECQKREIWNDIDKYTYMFTLTNQSIIDAKMMGNKFRFANHSKCKQNSYPKIVFSQGSYKIGIFSIKDINKGEEILFDYDGQNLLHAKYDWVDDLKKPSKKAIGGKRKREAQDELTISSDRNSYKNTSSKRRKFIKLNKRLKLNPIFKMNECYAKKDGFCIEIDAEESNF